MTIAFHLRASACAIAVLMAGCSGYDRLFVATKTNIGLDMDTKPPTAEVSIARRELAIQPTFKNVNDEDTANALPLMASFGLTGKGWLAALNPHITGTFAGGDAAVWLAKDPLTDSAEPNVNTVDSGICLGSKPDDTRSVLEKAWNYLTTFDPKTASKEINPRPFYFATDTAFGLKVAWSGTTGPYPDALKLGYNRKEFASAPIFVNSGCPQGTTTDSNLQESSTGGQDRASLSPARTTEKYHIHSPSFLATVDNDSSISSPEASGLTHTQFIATGEAANEIARRASVRQYYFSHIFREPARAESDLPKLNADLLADIEEAYGKATAAKEQEILDRAIELELVKEGTKADGLLQALDSAANSIAPRIAHRFYLLRETAN